MPGRVPAPADFPSSLTLSIVQPPEPRGTQTSNVLILLHGIGDSNVPFANLASQMKLPETACIALRAPAPLPFDLGGFHWGDDIQFDEGMGLKMDADAGFEKAYKIVVEDVIRHGLIAKCGFRPKEVHLFGFGQGGMVALGSAKRLEELGGVVSIGGSLPKDAQVSSTRTEKSKTATIILHGSSQSAITTTAANAIKAAFSHVEFHRWQRPGDAMPRNKDEMYPVMRFLARRLRSRAGVPESSQELA